MKFYFLTIFVFLLSCNHSKISEPVNSNSHSSNKGAVLNHVLAYDTMGYQRNDTFCYLKVNSGVLNSIVFLNACHIFFGDTASTRLVNDYTQERLPVTYNSDLDENAALISTRNGDTLSIRIGLINDRRNTILRPDTIYMKDSILYLIEREIAINNNPKMKVYKFEEFNYLFFVKGNSSIPIIKHNIIQLKN